MTIKKFIGIIGFLLSIAVAGSSAWFLEGVLTVDSVFYSRLFVLMIISFVSGWLIGEGFSRRSSFLFALVAMILGIAGALGHELFFVFRQSTDTATFKFIVNAAINGTLVSSFVLFGRNSCTLRFVDNVGLTEAAEEPVQNDLRSREEFRSEMSSDNRDESGAEVENVEYENQDNNREGSLGHTEVIEDIPGISEVVEFSELKEGVRELSHADSEKEPIFEATFFEKNAELIVEKAKLEAEKLKFEAQQELQKMKNEKVKLENELRMLVNTERNLLEQYKKQME